MTFDVVQKRAAASVATTRVRPGRLSRSVDVRATLRRGRSRSGDLLAVHARRRPEGPAARPDAADAAADAGAGVRLTVVASRRVGGAVQRNRAKRLLREAARTLAWRPGHDVVLVARAACAGSDLASVAAELTRLAGRLDLLAHDADGVEA